MRRFSFLLSLAAALLPPSSAGAVPRNAVSFSSFTPVNTADLPDRCPGEKIYVDMDRFDWKRFSAVPSAGGDDDQAITAMLELNTDSPMFATYFAKKTRYYSRRAEMQEKVEARLARLSGDALTKGLEDYAYVLGYLGEFQKVVEHFGPGGPRETANDGIIALSLAHAYFRLGRYADSVPYAKKAFDLLPDKKHDTRWQVMLSELGLHGDALYKNYSRDYYDLSHVKTLFPARGMAGLPFEDATDSMQIDKWSGTGGANFADLDGDGWDELIIQRKYFPSKVYRNDRGGALRSIPDAQVEGGYCDELVESVADYDNDGRPDLQRQCCNYDGPGPSRLLKNMGGLSFQDVTKASGLDYHVSGMHVAWGDYDLDGYLDIVVADQFGPVQVWRNNGDGTFTNATKRAGIVSPGTGGGPDQADYGAVGCSWADYDGDRYPDLACNGWGWSRLWHNNGDGTFTDVTAQAGVDIGKGARGYNSMWLDYDNDGKLDLYVGRYVVASGVKWGDGLRCTCSNLLAPDGFGEREWQNAGTIYRNNGDGTFTNMASTLKFLPLGVMGVNAADWNNDGCQDIAMGAGGPYAQQAEPYLFYQNNCDGTFTLKTPFTMRKLWGKGHGIAFGDYDHDGNLDVFLNNGGLFPGDVWPSLLLHNTGNANHFLELGLKGGPGTNAFAVGAQVELWAGKLHQLQELAAGGRFSATNTFRLHFGLAKNRKIDRLVVRWPNKRKDATELKNLPVDQAIELDEATGVARTLWTAPRGEVSYRAAGQGKRRRSSAAGAAAPSVKR